MQLLSRQRSTFCNLINKQMSQVFDQPSFAKLPSRKIIVIYGPQSRKLLQGIVTNNISNLFEQTKQKQDKKVALYTLFLNPKGKVITDAVLIRPSVYENGVAVPREDQIWIDVDSSMQSILIEHLRKYMWKKKVQIVNLSYEDDAPQIVAGFNKVLPDQFAKLGDFNQKAGVFFDVGSEDQISGRKSSNQDGGYANLAFFDPRSVKLGIRMICGPGQFIFKKQQQRSDQTQYNKICTLNGISRSQTMTNKLPFMFNSDLFNGFSFNKGCYLGQEIVARAYHTGIVRRRVFPYVLQDPNKQLTVGQTVFGNNKLQIGKVVQSYGGYGTILCGYLPLLQQNWPLKIEQPSAGVVNVPFEPQLKNYLTEMKKKQQKLQQIDL